MDPWTKRTSTHLHAWRASLAADTRGAHLVEYMLMVGLVALVSLLGYQRFGRAVTDKAEEQAHTVETWSVVPGEGSDAQALLGAGKETTTTGDGAGDDDDDDGDDGDDGGGLWGAVTGVASDAVDVAGDGLDMAGDALQAGAEFKQSFEDGVVKGAGAMVTGTVHAVTHPVETMEGLSYAMNHPFQTVWDIGSDYAGAVSDNPGEGLGTITLDVLFTVGTGGTAGAAVKGSRGATIAHKAASRAEELDTGQSVAGAGNDASEGGAPGVVKWADKWIAPVLIPRGIDLPWP
jgi:pilus assembly protein Flp/PilA